MTTNDSDPRRIAQALALAFVAACAALVLAASAGAADGSDPNGDPPLPPDRPNLVISAASVVPYGAEWKVSYTVANRGTATASAFHVAVQRNGSVEIKDTAHASLAPGASRSEVLYISRPTCYIPLRFVADSRHVVTESREFDNERWAVGIASATCTTQPMYKVKAVSFHAVDESGVDLLGSDEPYATFHAVGVDGTQHSTVSRVFGDVDTGDTVSFGAAEGCLYRSCVGGAAPSGMGISIELWEHDLGEIPYILNDTVTFFDKAGGIVDQWAGAPWLAKALVWVGDGLHDILQSVWADDLLGTQTYTYEPAYLASRLTAAGTSFTDSRTYTGGGATYTLSVLVTRTY